jgi:hypothetical protein
MEQRPELQFITIFNTPSACGGVADGFRR